MLWLVMPLAVFANDLPGEALWEAPPEVTSTPQTVPSIKNAAGPEDLKHKNSSQKKQRSKSEVYHNSNLPTEYLTLSNRSSTQSELVLPKAGTSELFKALRVGDVLDLSIPHSVVGFADEKSPVIAISQSGALRGLRFIGESYLEPNTRRIFIIFNRVIQGHSIYRFSGVAVSSAGQPGLLGEYHSREAEYFTGDFVASFAAGYFDGLVPRKTNVFGQVETDPSVDTAVKKGLASGALSTAERFREKLKKVPQFSELKGPFEIKLLVLEPATTK